MKRTLKILCIGISILILIIFTYERYFLTKWYDFKIGNIHIEVMSDECETCFLDWQIANTIWINTNNETNGKFQLYSEGPRLEFGFNKEKSELVINNPGFSSLFINIKKMQEIDVPHMNKVLKLNEYKIQWIITKRKQLIQLDSLIQPSKNWD